MTEKIFIPKIGAYIFIEGITPAYSPIQVYSQITKNHSLTSLCGTWRHETKYSVGRERGADSTLEATFIGDINNDDLTNWTHGIVIGLDTHFDAIAAPHTHIKNVWKVEDNAQSGAVTVSIPDNINATHLLVDNDGNFVVDATAISLTSVDIADEPFFTFSQCNPATVHIDQSANDVLLNWVHQITNGSGYEIHRGSHPYYTPDSRTVKTSVATGIDT